MTQPMPPNPNLPPEQLPDVGPLADAHQAALADLQQEWAGLSDKQKQQLVDAVYTAVAAGTVADLLTLPIDITGATAALTAAMAAIAAAAAHLLVAEAADQGVHVPAVHVPAAVFEPTAQVVAGTLGDELRITAARAALQYGPDANPTDVADAVRAALDARSGASETKQLGGALHGAMNTGRLASLRRAPTGAVYAQEMNDKNTCGPCREVNGRWLGNIPADLPQILAMYPDGAYGGYIDCLGGINCRGTITGVWRPDQVAAANRRRLLAGFDPAEHRDPHGRWSKLGALVEGIASGVAHEKQLGGGQQGVTKLATFNNGTVGIHKTVSDLTSYTMRPAKHDADAEELAAELGHRLGLAAPAVHRDSEHSFWQTVVPGTLGTNVDQAQAAKLADTDQGRIMGLLDIILNNRDRNAGNWLAEHPDNPHAPGIGAIDHGMAFDTRGGHEVYGALDVFGEDDFVRHYRARNPDPVHGPDSPYVFGDNDLSPQDIRTARQALADMRPQFERMGHLDWWEQAEMRLMAVGEHAKGTKVRIHA